MGKPDVVEEKNQDHLFKFIDEQIANAPEERPDFGPSQIREMDELEVGGIYRLVHIDDEEFGVPHYEEVIRIRKIDVETREFYFNYLDDTEVGEDEEDYRCLEDYSVMPYEVGTWNDINYISRVKK
jgi:hypothetical protein